MTIDELKAIWLASRTHVDNSFSEEHENDDESESDDDEEFD